MNQIQLLSDIVLHPKKYTHVVNVPGQFDAAEALYKNFYDEISCKVLDKIRGILLRSGKYVVINPVN